MAQREIITLNETTLQLTVPTAGDTYVAPRDLASATGVVVSEVTDGVGAVAHGLDTENAFTTGDLLKLLNNGVVKAYFDAEGVLFGQRHSPPTVVNAATYDLLVTDEILHVTYTDTGVVTITWPTAQMISGRKVIIKDAGFGATTYNITIATEGAETIDDAATAVISSDGSAIAIYCNASNLFIY